jgi:hypothetical protein
MAQQGDYPEERGPGYAQAAGFGPNGQDPRMRPPVTPEQWQQGAPPRQDPRLTPQYSNRPDPQPAFTPDPWQDPQQPRGQYPPPQPAWQQPYQPQPQYAPQPPQGPRKSRKGPLAFLGCGGLGALVILIAILASPSSPSSSSPPAASQQQTVGAPTQSAAPAQPAAKAAAKAPAAQTVTYVVTGSAADVTYGPAGTDLSGTVPMHVSKPLGTPLYYAINAQLQGGGSVTCQILVNGAVISSSTATGGYNIAQCEIGQDPLSGQWQDDNG